MPISGGGVTAISGLTIDANKDWNAKKITNLGAPSSANDAARQADVSAASPPENVLFVDAWSYDISESSSGFTTPEYWIWNVDYGGHSCDQGADAAINDQLVFYVYLKAGTYTFRGVMSKYSQMGIVTLYIDGAAQATTYDGYAGGWTYRDTWTVTDIVVAASGLKQIKLKTLSKNTSSTNYRIVTAGFVFEKTA